MFSLIQSLHSIIQGSNRLFMVDLNCFTQRFSRLYQRLKNLLLTLSPHVQPTLEHARNQQKATYGKLVQSFLGDLLIVIGKYHMYYETEYANETSIMIRIKEMHDVVDQACLSLPCKFQKVFFVLLYKSSAFQFTYIVYPSYPASCSYGRDFTLTFNEVSFQNWM